MAIRFDGRDRKRMFDPTGLDGDGRGRSSSARRRSGNRRQDLGCPRIADGRKAPEAIDGCRVTRIPRGLIGGRVFRGGFGVPRKGERPWLILRRCCVAQVDVDGPGVRDEAGGCNDNHEFQLSDENYGEQHIIIIRILVQGQLYEKVILVHATVSGRDMCDCDDVF